MKTGAYSLLNLLIQNGTEYIFGYPGGSILPIYDEIFFWEKKKLIKHILIRHEQSAAHAADAYSRTTKKVGVCFATSGPGATNLITGIATAKMDSIPLIIITGQVSRALIGSDAFQEIDIYNMTLPIVKQSYIIKNIELLPNIINEAFFLAQNGRPGPILIDIPKDIGFNLLKNNIPDQILYQKINFKYKNDYLLPNFLLNIFYKTLVFSKSPLFYLGGGSLKSNSFKIVAKIIKLFQIPNTTTLMGKTINNEKNLLSLGMLGMHGTAYANFAVSECDYLIAIGARFDDRVTGKLDEFAYNSKIIQVDIDSNEISKNRVPYISFLGDIKVTLKLLLNYIYKKKILFINNKKVWINKILNWKQDYPIVQSYFFLPKLLPQNTIQLISKIYENAIYTTDVGQHQMWSAQFLNPHPKKWISSGGLGTMGFGLPSALGAKIANPSQEVVCISGDASFQMSIQELGTLDQYNLNIKIIILNNKWQGMVRQWQEAFYGKRFSNSYMKNGLPLFEKIATNYNLNGSTIFFKKELYFNLLEQKYSLKTYLMNINITEIENCYPMITPGNNTRKMIGIKKKNKNIFYWVE